MTRQNLIPQPPDLDNPNLPPPYPPTHQQAPLYSQTMSSPTFITPHPLRPSLPTQPPATHKKVSIDCTATPPRRKAGLPKDLREALQSSLQSRLSRIKLTLPPGTSFGTEESPAQISTLESIKSSNRELARLVNAMFEGTGLSVMLIFPTESELQSAKKLWGSLVDAEIVHWGRGKPSTRRKSAKPKSGFGDVKQGGDTPGSPDVYILVGGGASFLQRARALAEENGMDKLVILINPNSDADSLPIDLDSFCESHFEHVYYYRPNPHSHWSGGVLFRKFPDDWLLGRISPIGTLQKLLVTPDKPSLDDIADALGKEQSKPQSELMRKLSGLMDWKNTS